mgnify:CR=1 FL=1
MRFWMTVAVVTGLALPVSAQDVGSPDAGGRSGPVTPVPVTPPGPDMSATPAAPATDGTSDAASAEADVSQLSIEEVIGQQLGAFNARDVDLAWQFASPMIRNLFGTPRNFGVMVNQAYPMVWDNSAVRFVATRESNAVTFQQVMVQDTNGKLHLLEYAMIKTSKGWKIDGVFLLPPPDVGT